MGQTEAKQKLQLISNSVIKIQKDIKIGKLTANDSDRIETILQRYSLEIESTLSKKLKAADIYEVEELIEVTKKELNSLRRESNLDQAAVPTNSFKRSPSKKLGKEKSKNLKGILEAVEEIRQQIRSGRLSRDDYNQLQRTLVGFSQQLSSVAKKYKKQEIDAAQKLVSSVTTELYGGQFEENIPAKKEENTASTSSLTRRKVEKVITRRQETPKLASRNNAGSLEDIESKMDILKSDVQVAEINKDKNRLRFLSKSIQTLMTDLQMLIVLNNNVVDLEKKLKLEQELIDMYHRIDKIKRQIITDNDTNHLIEQKKRESCIHELDDIETTIATISSTLNYQNYKPEREKVEQCRARLGLIEDLTEDIHIKKQQITNAVDNLEHIFKSIEAEDRLNKAEWKHYQHRINLNEFDGTSHNDTFKKNKEYLVQLRQELLQIEDVNQKLFEKKQYVLYNVQNNISALDQKAKENESKFKHEIEDEVTLRNVKKPYTQTEETLVEFLINWRNKFEQLISYKFSLEELKQILDELQYTKTFIVQQINGGKEIEKNEPIIDVKSSQKNVAIASSQNVLIDQNTPQLVKVTSKQLNLVSNTLPPLRAQLENIQRDIQTIQAHIENSRFVKENQLYKDIREKLELYRNEVINISKNGGENGVFSENLVKYIDNVCAMLENNVVVRKSTTTEDILIDIMSVSTRVADLGGKIKGFNSTIQDYSSIKNSLQEHQSYLKNLKISSVRPNLIKSRDDTLHQIGQYLAALESLKKNEDSSGMSEEEKHFNQSLRKLKEKVARYSGTYKNVLYKTIESDLKKCLTNVDGIYKEPNMALSVKQDIENSLVILEQKSSKDRSYDSLKRNVHDKVTNELTEIQQNISSVEQELNQKKYWSKEELDKLDARLTLSIVSLDNIKEDRFRDKKEKMYTEIHYNFARIQELMLTSRPKSTLNDAALLHQFDQEQAAAEVISSIENQVEIIRPQILKFVGLETSQKFFELDEILVRGTLKLDDLNVDQTSGLFNIKMNLMREIHKMSDILDERVNQTEQIEKYEKKIRVVLMKIDSFNGYFGDAEYSDLDEQIIKLKVNLSKLSINQELIARKEACEKEIDICMKKLSDAAKTRSPPAGTLV